MEKYGNFYKKTIKNSKKYPKMVKNGNTFKTFKMTF